MSDFFYELGQKTAAEKQAVGGIENPYAGEGGMDLFKKDLSSWGNYLKGRATGSKPQSNPPKPPAAPKNPVGPNPDSQASAPPKYDPYGELPIGAQAAEAAVDATNLANAGYRFGSKRLGMTPKTPGGLLGKWTRFAGAKPIAAVDLGQAKHTINRWNSPATPRYYDADGGDVLNRGAGMVAAPLLSNAISSGMELSDWAVNGVPTRKEITGTSDPNKAFDRSNTDSYMGKYNLNMNNPDHWFMGTPIPSWTGVKRLTGGLTFIPSGLKNVYHQVQHAGG